MYRGGVAVVGIENEIRKPSSDLGCLDTLCTNLNQSNYTQCVYVYIYIYIYICMCVELGSSLSFKHV